MAATVTKIDYLAKAAEAADKLYPKIVSLRCTHASGAKTYAQLLSAKKVTCASSASIAYQLAGILASGDVVGHRDAVGGSDANILRKKSTVAKAMTGVANLPKDKVDVVWVGKKYADLPAGRRASSASRTATSAFALAAVRSTAATAQRAVSWTARGVTRPTRSPVAMRSIRPSWWWSCPK